MLDGYQEFMQINAAAIEHEWQCVEFNVNVQQWNTKF